MAHPEEMANRMSFALLSPPPTICLTFPDIRGPEVSVEAAFSHESVLKLLPVESA